MTQIIDGTAIARTITEEIKQTIADLTLSPLLAFIQVGNDPPSDVYIKRKQLQAYHVGIQSLDIKLPHNISENEVMDTIIRLNHDPKVDGILLQLPIPAHLDPLKLCEAIDPTKDVDGFHPLNIGKLLLGDLSGFIPCTPHGIARLLHKSGITLPGKHVVILGRSNIVGKPLATLLMQKSPLYNATVTVAHQHTKHLAALTKEADILIVAIGQREWINASFIQPGAVVVDVGIHRKEGKIVGDVDFANVKPKCQAITPVPGGVGPMTIAMLLSNTLLSHQRRTR